MTPEIPLGTDFVEATRRWDIDLSRSVVLSDIVDSLPVTVYSHGSLHTGDVFTPNSDLDFTVITDSADFPHVVNRIARDANLDGVGCITPDELYGIDYVSLKEKPRGSVPFSYHIQSRDFRRGLQNGRAVGKELRPTPKKTGNSRYDLSGSLPSGELAHVVLVCPQNFVTTTGGDMIVNTTPQSGEYFFDGNSKVWVNDQARGWHSFDLAEVWFVEKSDGQLDGCDIIQLDPNCVKERLGKSMFVHGLEANKAASDALVKDNLGCDSLPNDLLYASLCKLRDYFNIPLYRAVQHMVNAMSLHARKRVHSDGSRKMSDRFLCQYQATLMQLVVERDGC